MNFSARQRVRRGWLLYATECWNKIVLWLIFIDGCCLTLQNDLILLSGWRVFLAEQNTNTRDLVPRLLWHCLYRVPSVLVPTKLLNEWPWAYIRIKSGGDPSFPPLPPFPLLLEVGPLNPARGLGSAVSFLPQPKLNLVHFSIKIWHMVATILIIFMKINWLNLAKIVSIIQWIPCALVQKMSTSEKVGRQNAGRSLHFKK